MSNDWIIKDVDFVQIRHTTIKEETLINFIDNVVYNHPNSSILLKNLSDIYILVANFGYQKFLHPGEKSWKEIMNKEQYDMLEKNNELIIAYMWIEKQDEDIHYIGLFDTIVRNNKLGYHMIKKYENLYEVILIPQEIIQSSAKYWAKILDILDDKGIAQKQFIDDFIKEFSINPKDISWKHLYNLCLCNEDKIY
jgi:hypothetical protein